MYDKTVMIKDKLTEAVDEKLAGVGVMALPLKGATSATAAKVAGVFSAAAVIGGGMYTANESKKAFDSGWDYYNHAVQYSEAFKAAMVNPAGARDNLFIHPETNVPVYDIFDTPIPEQIDTSLPGYEGDQIGVKDTIESIPIDSDRGLAGGIFIDPIPDATHWSDYVYISSNVEELKVIKPYSKEWGQTVKKLKEARGKLDIKVSNLQDAERLINEARPNLELTENYKKPRPKANYEVHPIDNPADLPHIKWRDWSKGKQYGAEGHIYFLD